VDRAVAAPGHDADVIVVGAGPAGATAAIRLAAAGRRVILCDRRAFPRDKACGDGLIADAINALGALGLLDRVRALAAHATRLVTVSPSGIDVHFDSTFLILPRRVFDRVLCDRAIECGAELRQLVVTAPIVDGGRIVGVRGHAAGREASVELRAPLTVLASGADSAVLTAFDREARSAPSGFAIRTYARLDGGRTLGELVISLERDLLPGYAWAFPVPEGLINVGVGWLASSRAPRGANLRRRLDVLLEGRGVLGRRLGPAAAVEAYRGAPLRTGLGGARLAQPGLAVIGEAAGTTYAVSGEGIGKAMESGLLLAAAAADGEPLSLAGFRYATAMTERFTNRFTAYNTAQRWLAFPFVADYVARRANASRWVHERLQGVLEERDLPNRVFSARSFWRLITKH
jgi:geranylgeranyl reductase family protein